MATLDFKQTHSWQDAVELGASLVTLAEALPSHEQTGLVMQLHQLMLDLPTQIAADLADGSRTRFVTIYRLASALELIEMIYPALDTADIHKDFERLSSRLDSDSFHEVISVAVSVDESENDGSTGGTEAEPEPTQESAKEVEIEKETSFPVSPTLSQAVTASPSGVPILGAPVSVTAKPDISGLPAGVEVNSYASPAEIPANPVSVTQAVDVQPNNL